VQILPDYTEIQRDSAVMLQPSDSYAHRDLDGDAHQILQEQKAIRSRLNCGCARARKLDAA
jgi:hypothetical protein